MLYKYEFTRLLVTNFTACFRFYRDVLGFQVGFGSQDGTYADFNLGAVNISLFDKQEMSQVLGTAHLPADASIQDKVCLVFAVENVDEVCQRLRALGVQLAAEPADHPDWGIRTAHLRDPDGNLIEINHPLRQADN
jgi:catechol 2,3-dioxygenase-like lactoylglutathione lyase family enzyme